jgi:UDP-2,3-diacylglucosamine pyrophosphatase LpxH
MANQLGFFKIYLLLFILATVSSCKKENDIIGFVYSPETADNRFEQSQTWNESHPFKYLTVNVDNYSILAASDTHIGGIANFSNFLIEAKKPEYVGFVMVGDIVTGLKDDYSNFQQLLPNYDEKPFFLLVGNHDLFFDGWKIFFDDFGTSTYWFTVQTPHANDIFICLDSGSGTLGTKQLTWLKNTLATQRNKFRNCIIFSHVNFFRNRHSGSSSLLVSELYVLLDLFAQNKVNMVVSGHDHVRALNIFGNTTYIIIGALRDSNPTAGYLKISIMDGKIVYEFRNIK